VIDTNSPRRLLRIHKRGAIFSPRQKLLLINGRDRTDPVDALERQIAAVRTVIAELTAGEPDVRGALFFPNLHGPPRLKQLTPRSKTIAIDAPRDVANLTTPGPNDPRSHPASRWPSPPAPAR